MFYIWREGLDVRNFGLGTCWAYFQSNPSFDSFLSCLSCYCFWLMRKRWGWILVGSWETLPSPKLIFGTSMYEKYSRVPSQLTCCAPRSTSRWNTYRHNAVPPPTTTTTWDSLISIKRHTINRLTAIRVLARSKNSRPVGFVRRNSTKSTVTTNPTINKHHHHGGAVCPWLGLILGGALLDKFLNVGTKPTVA